MDNAYIKKASVLDLLGLHSRILEELLTRRILRTVNNPVADYSEFLVRDALHLVPAPNSEKGYDATDANRTIKYQIKARRLAKGSKPTRFSAIRNLEEKLFYFVAAVLFTHDF